MRRKIRSLISASSDLLQGGNPEVVSVVVILHVPNGSRSGQVSANFTGLAAPSHPPAQGITDAGGEYFVKGHQKSPSSLIVKHRVFYLDAEERPQTQAEAGQ